MGLLIFICMTSIIESLIGYEQKLQLGQTSPESFALVF